ncbi:MAG: septal ring lytic transglycosylase RlpA family protein [Thermodesulfovibrionales bacterium]|nr:septal ring lytic transglycosylase RlpA family protein [Thermodesulfovibrionales bacterium]
MTLIMLSCTPSRFESKGLKTAIASWYGAEFHGRPTSSGEIFDMYKKTCAHREYPFGTRLKVTNLNTNKSVECIVNDRGPFIPGRDIDLSYGAAREIGLIATGTAPVVIELLGRDNNYKKEVKNLSIRGPYTIQIGSFREKDNALRLKDSLELRYKNVYIIESTVKNDTFLRVRIGKFNSLEEAMKIANSLAEEGYPAIIVQTE